MLVLGSCARHPGETVSRGTLYNSETTVDSEGYTFFKQVHEKAQFETQLAKYVSTTAASAEAKSLAGKVVETYAPMMADLSDFAATFSVLLVDQGGRGFAVPQQFQADTLGSFDNAGYIAHVQHEQGAILEQFNRLSRNTIADLQHYAHEKIPAVKTLFAAAGGQEDHSAHH